MASRKLEDLRPEFRHLVARWLDANRDAGLEILVYCTRRSPEEQAVLYRRGRKTVDILNSVRWLHLEGYPGLAATLASAPPQWGPVGDRHVVTCALPGLSYHQHGLAVDFVPLSGGKAMWQDVGSYRRAGNLAEDLGMVWSGAWSSFGESCHVQSSVQSSLLDPCGDSGWLRDLDSIQRGKHGKHSESSG